jgi:rSAM/selenodomain-associated transferase 2
MVRVSLIVPVLNEADQMASLDASLQIFKDQSIELIIVDGGSQDNTLAIAKDFADRVISSPRGRAVQMNAGAAAATGDILLFLHSDTILPETFLLELLNDFSCSDQVWGRFDVRLSGTQYPFRVIEYFMNFRSRLTGIATGDQALFIKQEAFRQVNGFPQIALMEDVAMSQQLKRLSRPFCSRQTVITSSRKWETHGIVATVLLMWRLRLAFFLGVNPEHLARIYYDS